MLIYLFAFILIFLEAKRREGSLIPIELHYDLDGGEMTADSVCLCQFSRPPFQECIHLPQHPEHFKHRSSLLGLKKMSRDKTSGNLKYKCSDAWSLGNGECVQLHAKEWSLLSCQQPRHSAGRQRGRSKGTKAERICPAEERASTHSWE